MKIYNLIGYYDIQSVNWAITLPKLWSGNLKFRFRKRGNMI
jgi:hypothetical protein